VDIAVQVVVVQVQVVALQQTLMVQVAQAAQA
jgi:hypothetical protein